MKQIKDFPSKSSVSNDDLFLLQDGADNAYKRCTKAELLTGTGGSGANTYKDLILQSRPFAYWRFENLLSNRVIDETRVNRFLSFTGGYSITTGRKGNGITLTTNGQGVLSNSFFPTHTDTIVAEAWIKRNGNPSTPEGICAKYVASGGTWLFYIAATGFVYFDIRTSSGYQSSNVSSAIVTDNNWHHVVGVRAINSLYIFVDGVKNIPAAVSSNSFSNTVDFTIGSLNNTNYFNGSIDEVALYHFLPDEEIIAHYSSTLL